MKNLKCLLVAILALAELGRAQVLVADSFNPGANGAVNSIVVQADGKVIASGDFTILGGQPLQNLGRLNVDGTPDPTFAASSNFGGPLAVLPDDKVLYIRGNINADPNRYAIERLNADGSPDPSFYVPLFMQPMTLVPQADGKILVGGNFSLVQGQSRRGIVRLNPDGSLDSGFNPQ
jgi:uncharacterized delta-60 repeat protein